MSRFLTGGAVAALALAACAFAGSASAQTYSRLVVFGDSLSDNGNLYLISGGTQPPSPPYYQGRFSSGQVWTERLGFNAGLAEAPAAGRAWKMSLAPPNTVTRSIAPNFPPAAV